MGVRLALTPGDPRGIGPEVARKSLVHLRKTLPDANITVYGPNGPLPPEALEALQSKGQERPRDGIWAAEIAASSIESAVEAALAGEIQGIVTGPLHKPSLRLSGRVFPGQTEMIASLANSGQVGMLMAAESTRLGTPLRVLLGTTHIRLRSVPDAVTTSLLVHQSTLLHTALVDDWGITDPSLGMCALNPHASDGGLFGDEEEYIYGPALESLNASGVKVTGPLPADTVFMRALSGEFDAVIAPYHDVGMAAFKTVSFGTGVNVTLGLPFIRTSPDHGTAFDISGFDKADPTSMTKALTLAHRLANNRFDTPPADV